MIRTLAALLTLCAFTASAQQSDYHFDDTQNFADAGPDINSHLAAIVHQNAGQTAPATTFPYMVWADTSAAAPVIRYRNAANSGWATAFRIDPSSTMWLGGITTGAATITGGSISGTSITNATITGGSVNGTVIGNSARADAFFNYIHVRRPAYPGLRLIEETGTPSTHNAIDLAYSASTFAINLLSNTGGSFISSPYAITTSASGATSHLWRIGGAERLRIQNTLITITGATLNAGLVNTQGVGIGVSGIYTTGGAVPNIGGLSARFATIFLANSPNVSSDQRLKTDIGDVAEAECRVANRIEIRRYRLESDPTGPWHFGAIAQEVIAAFNAEGLDWQDYAIVTGSEEETYGVAYDELQSLKLACM